MSTIGSILVTTVGARTGDAAARSRTLLAIAIAYLLLAAVIAYLSGGFWLINLTAAYAIMPALLGSNLLYGQLGLVSLAQYALVGIGGWVTLRLAHGLHLPFGLSLLAGGVAASAIGVAWGLPALRFRGIYLALLTLMLAGAFQSFISAFNFPAGGTGFFGTTGLAGRPRLLIDRPSIAVSDIAYFIYVAIAGLICLIVVELHRWTKPGRAWALIRRNPQLAAASGVRIALYQSWAFALAGFLAGIAGALLAGLYGQLDARGFTATESIILFAASVLSGTTNWIGAVVGAILIRAVPTLLILLGVASTYSPLVFGIALIGAVMGPPNGLSGLIDRFADRFADKARPPT